LHEARSCPRQNAERARRDLGVERPFVALAHAVELGAEIGDHAGKDIEPADRAFRVGEREGAFAQRHIFEQRDDIDAVLFEHGTLGQVDLVHRQQVELVAHARPGTRQKAGAHPVRDLAEPQIDARRLDLDIADRLRRHDLAADRHRLAQHLRGQKPGRRVALAVGVAGVGRGEQVGLGHAKFPSSALLCFRPTGPRQETAALASGGAAPDSPRSQTRAGWRRTCRSATALSGRSGTRR
jgi:hypothetical protein